MLGQYRRRWADISLPLDQWNKQNSYAALITKKYSRYSKHGYITDKVIIVQRLVPFANLLKKKIPDIEIWER